MWTPKGRTKSVYNHEVSTLVKLGVAMGHRLHTMVPFNRIIIRKTKGPGKKCLQRWGVLKGGVSTGRGSTVLN